MNVIEGLRANYQGKVLARAIRAVKEQGSENSSRIEIGSEFMWLSTKEGHDYWWAVCYNKPNPDQYLPENYVDVEEESFGKLMTKDAMDQVSSKVIAPNAGRDGLVNKTEEVSLWINVGERLPDHDNNVLAVLDGQVFVMAYLSFKEDGEVTRAWGKVYDGLDGYPIHDDNYSPTHWMEIPKPPKTTEK